jgi:thymidylate synthase
MFKVFEASSGDEAYRSIASAMLSGASHSQESRAGSTEELLHAVISISDPRQRWIVSRRPAINPAFAIAELIWIFAGRDDAQFLTYFNRALPIFAGEGLAFHGAYGRRLRRHFRIDQLQRAYEILSWNPDNRQVVLQIWDPTSDLPDSKGNAAAADIPCNIASMLKIRKGALEWTQIMRSNDLFRGFPYNLVQFTVLLEVIAGWIGVAAGSYHHLSDSLHVYSDCTDLLRKTAVCTPEPNTDSLAMRKEDFDQAIRLLEDRTLMIIDESRWHAEDLFSMISKDLPQTSIRNLLCIICAEGARRRGAAEVATGIMTYCSNPVLRQVWSNWMLRVQAPRTQVATVV